MNFDFKQKPIGIRTVSMAILLGTFVGYIMVSAFGYHPNEIFGTLIKGAFGSPKAIASSLRWSAPLMFTGVAAAIAFKGGMFNFGLDGQIYIGGLAGTITGLIFINLPGILLIPLMMTVSMIFGAAWALLPAYIRVKLGGSEIVPALMMNYIAVHLTDFLVHYYFLASGTNGDSLKTERIAPQAQFSNLIQGYPITAAIFIGLTVVLIFWFLMKKSKLGYQILMTGENDAFARYGGIRTDYIRTSVMLISGAIAGLGGIVEIMAVRWRFESGFAPSYGNDGILAALLGSSTPAGTLLGALFMGSLKSGSLAVERYTDVSRAFASVIQGIIICFISARLISKYLGWKSLQTWLSSRKKEVLHD